MHYCEECSNGLMEDVSVGMRVRVDCHWDGDGDECESWGWVIGLLCFGGRLCLVLVVIVLVICCYGSMYA